MEQLSKSFRPRTFDEMVGQEELIKRIRGFVKKRTPTAWLFVGETGSGKTTIAGILALAFQCTHQKEFGNPCKKCYKNRFSFDITEINASSETGKEEVKKLLADSDLYPKHGSKSRVYILDEIQKFSDHTQNMLLKKLETSPKECKWILATSDPDSVIRAMWRRVISEKLDPLTEDGIKELIRRVMKFAEITEEELSPIKLTEALLENGVSSSGFVVKAIEKKLAGHSYEKAAIVEFTSDFNPRHLIRSLVKGDWDGVRKHLTSASLDDARQIRRVVSSYLSTILIESEDIGGNTDSVAKAIIEITDATGENSVVLARVRAVCYKVCRIFKRNPR